MKYSIKLNAWLLLVVLLLSLTPSLTKRALIHPNKRRIS